MHIELTPSQQRASEKLDFFFKLGLSNLDSIEGISPRPIPLIAGPSGCGKTFMVGQVAQQYGIPMFCINAQNWIVRGARNDAQVTMDQIKDFVSENDHGVIFIDEINKLHNSHVGSSAWSADVFSELIAFLDRDQRLDSMGLNGLVEKVKQRFLIVGAAAFQEQWQQSAESTQSIGFGESGDSLEGREDAYELAIRNQDVVPEELLFRFNDRLVIIAPPTAAEFSGRIVSLRAALSLPPLPVEELRNLAFAAVESQKCMRWIEGYLSECLTQITPEALESLATLKEQDESPADPSSKAARSTTSAEERKKLVEIRDAAWDKYELSLKQLSLSSRKLCLLLNAVLLAEKSDALSPDRIPLFKCLPHIGEILSPEQPSSDFPATLSRGLDYIALHALITPSSVISTTERGKYSRGIRDVCAKIVEVLPILIARCGTDLEGQNIRDKALDFGVFAERAFVYLDDVSAIDPSGKLRRKS